MIIDFKDSFSEALTGHPFVLMDIGARAGLKKEWEPLKKYLKVVAFEPEQAEYEKLAAKNSSNGHLYFNTALFDSKRELTFHVTKINGLSSVFPPNQEFLNHFDITNSHGYEVIEKIPLAADRVDDVVPENLHGAVDFVKIDAEGATLPILRGAERLLDMSLVLGLRVEAEFNEKYKGESLFSEVDCFLRKYQYQLFHIKPCYWKRKEGLQTGGSQGQLIHGDFFYFLDPSIFFVKLARMGEKERPAKVIKYILSATVYGHFDLAYEILKEAAARKLLNPAQIQCAYNGLSASQTILSRIPKLKEGSTFQRLVYHLFMLCGGIWLERRSFWNPTLRLS